LGSDAAVSQGDASSPELLARAAKGCDQIVFCAGGLMPAAANADPHLDAVLSLNPLIQVLEWLRTNPEVRLTFMSSGGTVYGNQALVPVGETAPTDPVSAYGVSKLASEKYIGMYRALYGISATILRVSNVYGENQPANRNQGVIATFLDRMLRGLPITIYGNGTAVRDYVYVQDIAEAVVDLLDLTPGPPIINVGSGQGHSVAEVVEHLGQVTGIEADIRHAPGRDFDVREIVLDIARLRSLIDFNPTPLRQGLEATWRGVRPGADTAKAGTTA
jgi:UDP-glucose 4-epimerase